MTTPTPDPDEVAREIVQQNVGSAIGPVGRSELQRAIATALRARDEAHRAERERAGWQPIETAPKDGTTILGWAEDEEDGWQIMVVKWVETQDDPGSKYVMHDAGWAGRIMFPGCLSDDDDPVAPTFTITHWQPLPLPPEGDSNA